MITLTPSTGRAGDAWPGRIVKQLAALAALAGALAAAPVAEAAPLVPTSGDQVVETLPTAGRARLEERALRRRWAAEPGNAELSVELARRYLTQAREQGDPRHAGRALAVLKHWPDLDQAPPAVVVMAATLQQYLHDFDGAAGLLERLVQRDPSQAQAWLTLATIRRVQGRYDASDRACQGVRVGGSSFHAQACEAENLSLRGRLDAARRLFDSLLAPKDLPAATRAWVTTTVAETEARHGRPMQAEAAFRAALALAPDDYTRIAQADFLLAQGRAAEVPAALSGAARSDAVLLRLAIAGKRHPGAATPADIQELRARMAQAALRPEARTAHAREQAMFALHVDGQAQRALDFARRNVALQREPIDLIVLAEAARAAQDKAALQDVKRLKTEMGLHDVRLDALL